jgi:hypothetical protein
MSIGCKEIIFSGHAVRRMFQRNLSADDVREVVEKGEIIAHYPDDVPYPSFLIFYYIQNRPIHGGNK